MRWRAKGRDRDGKLIEGPDSLASWKGNLLEECEECRDDCLTRDALQLIKGAHCRSLSVEADRKHQYGTMYWPYRIYIQVTTTTTTTGSSLRLKAPTKLVGVTF